MPLDKPVTAWLQQASGAFIHIWAGADHNLTSSLLEDGCHFVLSGMSLTQYDS